MSNDRLWSSGASSWAGVIPNIDNPPPLLDPRASNSENARIMGKWLELTFAESGKRLSYAIATKGYWITSPPVNGYAVMAAMQTFSRAINDFVCALNRIPNTEPRAGGNFSGRGDGTGASSADAVQIDNVQDLIQFVQALTKAGEIGEVDPPADKSLADGIGSSPPPPPADISPSA